ncbi:MAG: taurine dioxygenase, partial [Gammaproteobacteria bacterium]
MMKVEKSNLALGAEISDFDLSRNLSDDEISNFINVLSENEVVFIRDQNISHEDHKRLATYFGSLQTHPAYPTVEGFPEITILENDRENPSKIEEWHTDMTFKANPPLGSILIGRIIPETGGDTLFSSLSAAFSDLDK